MFSDQSAIYICVQYEMFLLSAAIQKEQISLETKQVVGICGQKLSGWKMWVLKGWNFATTKMHKLYFCNNYLLYVCYKRQFIYFRLLSIHHQRSVKVVCTSPKMPPASAVKQTVQGSTEEMIGPWNPCKCCLCSVTLRVYVLKKHTAHTVRKSSQISG